MKCIKTSKKNLKIGALKNTSSYDKRALTLVAKEFEKALTNFQIRDVIHPIICKNGNIYSEEEIRGYLIDERLEEYPFYTFGDTLQTILKKDKNASKIISVIISELLNPLNYEADKDVSDIMANNIEKYIRCCDFSIVRERNKYIVIPTHKNSLNVDSYKISIKDREVRINDFLLSKPYATGENLALLEYVVSKSAGLMITKENIPEYAKPHKTFIKVLSELGFKGEILKAFFPKRSKSTLVFKGKYVTDKDLRDVGVNIEKFIKELKSANHKNNPK